jgi:hypothetical protein
MSNYPKKILLAFSSFPGRSLLREIFTQLDRRIRVDLAGNEPDVLNYLSRNARKQLPGLILLDNPPVSPTVVSLVENIRRENLYAEIPIAILLPAAHILTMKNWLHSKGVYFFREPFQPSEYKLYARQMLDLYNEPGIRVL